MRSDLFIDQFNDNAFLQSVIESIEEGVIIENACGIIIGFNDRALQILGMTADEVTGKTFYDKEWNCIFIDGTDAHGDLHPISITLRTEEAQHNKILGLRIKSQPLKWININTRLIASNSGNYGLATFSDITELVESTNLLNQQKEKLRVSEEKFTNIFNYSRIANAITSADGTILDVNETTCTMLGYSQLEIIGKHYSFFTYPEDLESSRSNLLKLINKEIEFYDGERRYFRKDGSICWALNTVSPVYNETGELQFFIAQIQEITQLKHLNKNLEEQNIKLTSVQQILEKKVAQLKDFAGIITHDVRGPAHNIKKMLEMYETAPDDEIRKAAMDYLKKVSNDLASNLNELIQILQIQLESDLPNSDCLFTETIESVSLQLQDSIQKKQAIIETSLEVTNIMYPKVYLQSIIYNLMSNSLKYSKPAEAPIIQIRTYKEHGSVYMRFTDQGLGIDMQKYGHLLFKFQKSFHSGQDSKGIGLYLIKNQIEYQGGAISAASEPGKGTIFTVRF